MLAVEWLNKKMVFGIKADLNEMSSFKSKVKKITLPEDPKPEEPNVSLIDKAKESLGQVDLDKMTDE